MPKPAERPKTIRCSTFPLAGSATTATDPSRPTNYAPHRAHRALGGEKAAIADDIKDVYGEGKATGFDTKTMRIDCHSPEDGA
jgi:hypothetical protein